MGLSCEKDEAQQLVINNVIPDPIE